jgi:2-polyprenyl-6-methoxyphenol hydroxylase-like FAD-dependent oxidoreductase
MRTTDVLVVGAGATGLYLSCLLKHHHIEHLVIDAKPGLSTHSRSIGIHPASFPLLEEIGVLADIRAEATLVTSGQAFDRRHFLGTLPLGSVLTLPQFRTEAILERHANPVDYYTRFEGFHHDGEFIEIHTSTGPIRATTLIGADGMHSAVRKAMNIESTPIPYPYSFFMGDMHDNTSFGADAVIFLHPDGMTESFPLGGHKRRWVVMKRGDETESIEGLVKEIEFRTGHTPDPATSTMFSAFKAYRHIAPRMHDRNVFLAGDAAHVTSPIGGQGMNLGWLNARDLIRNWDEPARYEAIAKRRAEAVIRRAEFNMSLGGKSQWHGLRSAGVRLVLNLPVRASLTRRFTMQDL